MTVMTTQRTVVQIRLDPGQKAVIERDARAAGMSLSDWIRFCTLQRAGSTSKTLNTNVVVPVEPPRRGGCALCGEKTGQLHKKSCALGGTVTAR